MLTGIRMRLCDYAKGSTGTTSTAFGLFWDPLVWYFWALRLSASGAICKNVQELDRRLYSTSYWLHVLWQQLLIFLRTWPITTKISECDRIDWQCWGTELPKTMEGIKGWQYRRQRQGNTKARQKHALNNRHRSARLASVTSSSTVKTRGIWNHYHTTH